MLEQSLFLIIYQCFDDNKHNKFCMNEINFVWMNMIFVRTKFIPNNILKVLMITSKINFVWMNMIFVRTKFISNNILKVLIITSKINFCMNEINFVWINMIIVRTKFIPKNILIVLIRTSKINFVLLNMILWRKNVLYQKMFWL